MTSGFDAMVFIPYTTGPSSAPAYEDWLRRVDNPFFNTRPGIAEYANWKVVESTGPLPFTHFDFLGLTGAAALETVWFDSVLDEFRRGWVAKWGYGTGAPNPTTHYAYLLEEPRPLRVAPAAQLVVAGWSEAEVPPLAENWRATSVLRKHWAIGRAPAGESWRRPPTALNPLGLHALSVFPVADAARWRDALSGAPRFAFLAECIASPSRPEI